MPDGNEWWLQQPTKKQVIDPTAGATAKQNQVDVREVGYKVNPMTFQNAMQANAQRLEKEGKTADDFRPEWETNNKAYRQHANQVLKAKHRANPLPIAKTPLIGANNYEGLGVYLGHQTTQADVGSTRTKATPGKFYDVVGNVFSPYTDEERAEMDGTYRMSDGTVGNLLDYQMLDLQGRPYRIDDQGRERALVLSHDAKGNPYWQEVSSDAAVSGDLLRSMYGVKRQQSESMEALTAMGSSAWNTLQSMSYGTIGAISDFVGGVAGKENWRKFGQKMQNLAGIRSSKLTEYAESQGVFDSWTGAAKMLGNAGTQAVAQFAIGGIFGQIGKAIGMGAGAARGVDASIRLGNFMGGLSAKTASYSLGAGYAMYGMNQEAIKMGIPKEDRTLLMGMAGLMTLASERILGMTGASGLADGFKQNTTRENLKQIIYAQNRQAVQQFAKATAGKNLSQEAKEKVAQGIVSNMVKGIYNVGKSAFTGLGKVLSKSKVAGTAVEEGLEEAIEEVGNFGVKTWYDNFYADEAAKTGKGKFGADISLENLTEAFVGGLMGGTIAGAMSKGFHGNTPELEFSDNYHAELALNYDQATATQLLQGAYANGAFGDAAFDKDGELFDATEPSDGKQSMADLGLNADLEQLQLAYQVANDLGLKDPAQASILRKAMGNDPALAQRALALGMEIKRLEEAVKENDALQPKLGEKKAALQRITSGEMYAEYFVANLRNNANILNNVKKGEEDYSERLMASIEQTEQDGMMSVDESRALLQKQKDLARNAKASLDARTRHNQEVGQLLNEAMTPVTGRKEERIEALNKKLDAIAQLRGKALTTKQLDTYKASIGALQKKKYKADRWYSAKQLTKKQKQSLDFLGKEEWDGKYVGEELVQADIHMRLVESGLTPEEAKERMEELTTEKYATPPQRWTIEDGNPALRSVEEGVILDDGLDVMLQEVFKEEGGTTFDRLNAIEQAMLSLDTAGQTEVQELQAIQEKAKAALEDVQFLKQLAILQAVGRLPSEVMKYYQGTAVETLLNNNKEGETLINRIVKSKELQDLVQKENKTAEDKETIKTLAAEISELRSSLDDAIRLANYANSKAEILETMASKLSDQFDEQQNTWRTTDTKARLTFSDTLQQALGVSNDTVSKGVRFGDLNAVQNPTSASFKDVVEMQSWWHNYLNSPDKVDQAAKAILSGNFMQARNGSGDKDLGTLSVAATAKFLHASGNPDLSWKAFNEENLTTKDSPQKGDIKEQMYAAYHMRQLLSVVAQDPMQYWHGVRMQYGEKEGQNAHGWVQLLAGEMATAMYAIHQKTTPSHEAVLKYFNSTASTNMISVLGSAGTGKTHFVLKNIVQQAKARGVKKFVVVGLREELAEQLKEVIKPLVGSTKIVTSTVDDIDNHTGGKNTFVIVDEFTQVSMNQMFALANNNKNGIGRDKQSNAFFAFLGDPYQTGPSLNERPLNVFAFGSITTLPLKNVHRTGIESIAMLQGEFRMLLSNNLANAVPYGEFSASNKGTHYTPQGKEWLGTSYEAYDKVVEQAADRLKDHDGVLVVMTAADAADAASKGVPSEKIRHFEDLENSPQGKEWDDVFVALRQPDGMNNTIMYHYALTAASRAKKFLAVNIGGTNEVATTSDKVLQSYVTEDKKKERYNNLRTYLDPFSTVEETTEEDEVEVVEDDDEVEVVRPTPVQVTEPVATPKKKKKSAKKKSKVKTEPKEEVEPPIKVADDVDVDVQEENPSTQLTGKVVELETMEGKPAVVGATYTFKLGKKKVKGKLKGKKKKMLVVERDGKDVLVPQSSDIVDEYEFPNETHVHHQTMLAQNNELSFSNFHYASETKPTITPQHQVEKGQYRVVLENTTLWGWYGNEYRKAKTQPQAVAVLYDSNNQQVAAYPIRDNAYSQSLLSMLEQGEVTVEAQNGSFKPYFASDKNVEGMALSRAKQRLAELGWSVHEVTQEKVGTKEKRQTRTFVTMKDNFSGNTVKIEATAGQLSDLSPVELNTLLSDLNEVRQIARYNRWVLNSKDFTAQQKNVVMAVMEGTPTDVQLANFRSFLEGNKDNLYIPTKLLKGQVYSEHLKLKNVVRIDMGFMQFQIPNNSVPDVADDGFSFGNLFSRRQRQVQQAMDTSTQQLRQEVADILGIEVAGAINFDSTLYDKGFYGMVDKQGRMHLATVDGMGNQEAAWHEATHIVVEFILSKQERDAVHQEASVRFGKGRDGINESNPKEYVAVMAQRYARERRNLRGLSKVLRKAMDAIRKVVLKLPFVKKTINDHLRDIFVDKKYSGTRIQDIQERHEDDPLYMRNNNYKTFRKQIGDDALANTIINGLARNLSKQLFAPNFNRTNTAINAMEQELIAVETGMMYEALEVAEREARDNGDTLFFGKTITAHERTKALVRQGEQFVPRIVEVGETVDILHFKSTISNKDTAIVLDQQDRPSNAMSAVSQYLGSITFATQDIATTPMAVLKHQALQPLKKAYIYANRAMRRAMLQRIIPKLDINKMLAAKYRHANTDALNQVSSDTVARKESAETSPTERQSELFKLIIQGIDRNDGLGTNVSIPGDATFEMFQYVMLEAAAKSDDYTPSSLIRSLRDDIFDEANASPLAREINEHRMGLYNFLYQHQMMVEQYESFVSGKLQPASPLYQQLAAVDDLKQVYRHSKNILNAFAVQQNYAVERAVATINKGQGRTQVREVKADDVQAIKNETKQANAQSWYGMDGRLRMNQVNRTLTGVVENETQNFKYDDKAFLTPKGNTYELLFRRQEGDQTIAQPLLTFKDGAIEINGKGVIQLSKGLYAALQNMGFRVSQSAVNLMVKANEQSGDLNGLVSQVMYASMAARHFALTSLQNSKEEGVNLSKGQEQELANLTTLLEKQLGNYGKEFYQTLQGAVDLQAIEEARDGGSTYHPHGFFELIDTMAQAGVFAYGGMGRMMRRGVNGESIYRHQLMNNLTNKLSPKGLRSQLKRLSSIRRKIQQGRNLTPQEKDLQASGWTHSNKQFVDGQFTNPMLSGDVKVQGVFSVDGIDNGTGGKDITNWTAADNLLFTASLIERNNRSMFRNEGVWIQLPNQAQRKRQPIIKWDFLYKPFTGTSNVSGERVVTNGITIYSEKDGKYRLDSRNLLSLTARHYQQKQVAQALSLNRWVNTFQYLGKRIGMYPELENMMTANLDIANAWNEVTSLDYISEQAALTVEATYQMDNTANAIRSFLELAGPRIKPYLDKLANRGIRSGSDFYIEKSTGNVLLGTDASLGSNIQVDGQSMRTDAIGKSAYTTKVYVYDKAQAEEADLNEATEEELNLPFAVKTKDAITRYRGLYDALNRLAATMRGETKDKKIAKKMKQYIGAFFTANQEVLGNKIVPFALLKRNTPPLLQAYLTPTLWNEATGQTFSEKEYARAKSVMNMNALNMGNQTAISFKPVKGSKRIAIRELLLNQQLIDQLQQQSMYSILKHLYSDQLKGTKQMLKDTDFHNLASRGETDNPVLWEGYTIAHHLSAWMVMSHVQGDPTSFSKAKVAYDGVPMVQTVIPYNKRSITNTSPKEVTTASKDIPVLLIQDTEQGHDWLAGTKYYNDKVETTDGSSWTNPFERILQYRSHGANLGQYPRRGVVKSTGMQKDFGTGQVTNFKYSEDHFSKKTLDWMPQGWQYMKMMLNPHGKTEGSLWHKYLEELYRAKQTKPNELDGSVWHEDALDAVADFYEEQQLNGVEFDYIGWMVYGSGNKNEDVQTLPIRNGEVEVDLETPSGEMYVLRGNGMLDIYEKVSMLNAGTHQLNTNGDVVEGQGFPNAWTLHWRHNYPRDNSQHGFQMNANTEVEDNTQAPMTQIMSLVLADKLTPKTTAAIADKWAEVMRMGLSSLLRKMGYRQPVSSMNNKQLLRAFEQQIQDPNLERHLKSLVATEMENTNDTSQLAKILETPGVGLDFAGARVKTMQYMAAWLRKQSIKRDMAGQRLVVGGDSMVQVYAVYDAQGNLSVMDSHQFQKKNIQSREIIPQQALVMEARGETLANVFIRRPLLPNMAVPNWKRIPQEMREEVLAAYTSTDLNVKRQLMLSLKDNGLLKMQAGEFIVPPYIHTKLGIPTHLQLDDIYSLQENDQLVDARHTLANDIEGGAFEDLAAKLQPYVLNGLRPTVQQEGDKLRLAFNNPQPKGTLLHHLLEKAYVQFDEKFGAFKKEDAPKQKLDELRRAVVSQVTNDLTRAFKGMSKALDTLAVRTPSGPGSAVRGRIVGFIHDDASKYYGSALVNAINGKDLDIDQDTAYYRSLTDYALGLTDVKSIEDIQNELMDLLFDRWDSVANTAQTQSPILLGMLQELANGGRKNLVGHYEHAWDYSTNIKMRLSTMDGLGVGAFALGQKTTTLVSRTEQALSDSMTINGKTVQFKWRKGQDYNELPFLIEALTNAATDNAKLNILGMLGINRQNSDALMMMLYNIDDVKEFLQANEDIFGEYDPNIDDFSAVIKVFETRASQDISKQVNKDGNILQEQGSVSGGFVGSIYRAYSSYSVKRKRAEATLQKKEQELIDINTALLSEVKAFSQVLGSMQLPWVKEWVDSLQEDASLGFRVRKKTLQSAGAIAFSNYVDVLELLDQDITMEDALNSDNAYVVEAATRLQEHHESFSKLLDLAAKARRASSAIRQANELLDEGYAKTFGFITKYGLLGHWMTSIKEMSNLNQGIPAEPSAIDKTIRNVEAILGFSLKEALDIANGYDGKVSPKKYLKKATNTSKSQRMQRVRDALTENVANRRMQVGYEWSIDQLPIYDNKAGFVETSLFDFVAGVADNMQILLGAKELQQQLHGLYLQQQVGQRLFRMRSEIGQDFYKKLLARTGQDQLSKRAYNTYNQQFDKMMMGGWFADPNSQVHELLDQALGSRGFLVASKNGYHFKPDLRTEEGRKRFSVEALDYIEMKLPAWRNQYSEGSAARRLLDRIEVIPYRGRKQLIISGEQLLGATNIEMLRLGLQQLTPDIRNMLELHQVVKSGFDYHTGNLGKILTTTLYKDFSTYLDRTSSQWNKGASSVRQEMDDWMNNLLDKTYLNIMRFGKYNADAGEYLPPVGRDGYVNSYRKRIKVGGKTIEVHAQVEQLTNLGWTQTGKGIDVGLFSDHPLSPNVLTNAKGQTVEAAYREKKGDELPKGADANSYWSINPYGRATMAGNPLLTGQEQRQRLQELFDNVYLKALKDNIEAGNTGVIEVLHALANSNQLVSDSSKRLNSAMVITRLAQLAKTKGNSIEATIEAIKEANEIPQLVMPNETLYLPGDSTVDTNYDANKSRQLLDLEATQRHQQKKKYKGAFKEMQNMVVKGKMKNIEATTWRYIHYSVQLGNEHLEALARQSKGDVQVLTLTNENGFFYEVGDHLLFANGLVGRVVSANDPKGRYEEGQRQLMKTIGYVLYPASYQHEGTNLESRLRMAQGTKVKEGLFRQLNKFLPNVKVQFSSEITFSQVNENGILLREDADGGELIHEYGHLWSAYLQQDSRWSSWMESLRGSKLWSWIENNYADASEKVKELEAMAYVLQLSYYHQEQLLGNVPTELHDAIDELMSLSLETYIETGQGTYVNAIQLGEQLLGRMLNATPFSYASSSELWSMLNVEQTMNSKLSAKVAPIGINQLDDLLRIRTKSTDPDFASLQAQLLRALRNGERMWLSPQGTMYNLQVKQQDGTFKPMTEKEVLANADIKRKLGEDKKLREKGASSFKSFLENVTDNGIENYGAMIEHLRPGWANIQNEEVIDQYMLWVENLVNSVGYNHKYDKVHQPKDLGISPELVPKDALIIEHNAGTQANSYSIVLMTNTNLNDKGLGNKARLGQYFGGNRDIYLQSRKSDRMHLAGTLLAMALKDKVKNARIHRVGALHLKANKHNLRWAFLPSLLGQAKHLFELPALQQQLSGALFDLVVKDDLYDYGNYDYDLYQQISDYAKTMSVRQENSKAKEVFASMQQAADEYTSDVDHHTTLRKVLHKRRHYIRMALKNDKAKLANDREYQQLSVWLLQLGSGYQGPVEIGAIDLDRKYIRTPDRWEDPVSTWVLQTVHKGLKAVQNELLPQVEWMNGQVQQLNKKVGALSSMRDRSKQLFEPMFKKVIAKNENGDEVLVNINAVHHDFNDPDTQKALQENEGLTRDHVLLGAQLMERLKQEYINYLMEVTPYRLGQNKEAEATRIANSVFKGGYLPVLPRTAGEALSQGEFNEAWKTWIDSMSQIEAPSETYYEGATKLGLEKITSVMWAQLSEGEAYGGESRLAALGLQLEMDGSLTVLDPKVQDAASYNLQSIFNVTMDNSIRARKLKDAVKDVNVAMDIIKGMQATGKDTRDLEEVLLTYANRTLYGRLPESKTMTVMGASIAIDNVATAAGRFMHMTHLALAPVTSAKNVVGTATKMMTNAAINAFSTKDMFTPSNVSKAVQTLTKNPDLVTLLNKEFKFVSMSERDLINHFQHNATKKHLLDADTQMLGFWYGDYYMKLLGAMAQMDADGVLDAYQVVDGKLVYDETKDARFKGDNGQLLKQAVLNDRIREGEQEKGALTGAYSSQDTLRVKTIIERYAGEMADPTFKSHIQAFGLARAALTMKTYLLNVAQYWWKPSSKEAGLAKRKVEDGKVILDMPVVEGVLQTLYHTAKTLWKRPKDLSKLSDFQRRNLVSVSVYGVAMTGIIALVALLLGDDEDSTVANYVMVQGMRESLSYGNIAKVWEDATKDNAIISQLENVFNLGVTTAMLPMNTGQTVSEKADEFLLELSKNVPDGGLYRNTRHLVMDIFGKAEEENVVQN